MLDGIIKNGGNVNDELNVKYLNAKYITKETPLMEATKYDCLNLVKKLVEFGADINNYNYKNGKGPLSNCIIYDNIEVLEYLVIQRKADIPKYVFVRPESNGVVRQELTLIEFLNEQTYPENSRNDKYKNEIISYIKSL